MDLREAVKSRRSVKKFDPEHTMPEAELKELISYAMLTPTSFNMQNYHIVAVQDPEVQEKLKAAAWNQDQVADCSVVLVITGEFEAHHRTDRYLRNMPEDIRSGFIPVIMQSYDGNDQLTRDEACRTAGLVAMTIMLMARDMGYDTCPMIGFDPAQVSDILGLDASHPPMLMVTVGKALEPARGRLGILSMEELVSVNRYGQHTLSGEAAAE